jgi:hypothetical protein
VSFGDPRLKTPGPTAAARQVRQALERGPVNEREAAESSRVDQRQLPRPNQANEIVSTHFRDEPDREIGDLVFVERWTCRSRTRETHLEVASSQLRDHRPIFRTSFVTAVSRTTMSSSARPARRGQRCE